VPPHLAFGAQPITKNESAIHKANIFLIF
jgi:hypothetical protein